ncbi:MAG: teichoic acid transporter [Bacteroidetes bacterium]|nr:teichoic acid transporter [Bacteroidota bacterium]
MIKNILHTLFAKIITSVIGLLTIVLVSQYLGAIGKGEQSIFLFNIVLLLLISTLVGNTTLIYLTPRHKFSDIFFPSFIWTVACLGILFIAFWLLNIPIITYPKQLFLITLMAAFSETNTNILIGKERIKQSNILKLISSTASILYIIILIFLNQFTSITDYINSLLIGYFLSLVCGIYLLRYEYKELQFNRFFNLNMFKTLFSLGFIKQLGNLSQQLNARMSFYLIALYSSSQALGVFSNGISITESTLLFSSSLALVQYSRLSNSKDEGYSKLITLLLTKANILLSFLALLILSLLPESFYTFVFGAEFSQVKQIIQLLFLGVLLLNATTTFTQYFASKGNFHIATIASTIGLIPTLVLGLLLIPRYGIAGAAISTTLSYTIIFLIEYYYFRKYSNAKLKDLIPKKEDFNYFITLIKTIKK